MPWTIKSFSWFGHLWKHKIISHRVANPLPFFHHRQHDIIEHSTFIMNKYNYDSSNTDLFVQIDHTCSKQWLYVIMQESSHKFDSGWMGWSFCFTLNVKFDSKRQVWQRSVVLFLLSIFLYVSLKYVICRGNGTVCEGRTDNYKHTLAQRIKIAINFSLKSTRGPF